MDVEVLVVGDYVVVNEFLCGIFEVDVVVDLEVVDVGIEEFVVEFIEMKIECIGVDDVGVVVLYKDLVDVNVVGGF